MRWFGKDLEYVALLIRLSPAFHELIASHPSELLSNTKFLAVIEAAIAKCPAQSQQQIDLYHVLKWIHDKYRMANGAEDLIRTFAQVRERAINSGLVSSFLLLDSCAALTVRFRTSRLRRYS